MQSPGPLCSVVLANSLWIFAWHYGYFPLSLLLMLVLLGALITIYARLWPAYTKRPQPLSAGVRICHFAVYLGWITVATIANTTIVLYDQGWRGAPLSAPLWAVILLGVAGVIGMFFALRLRDAAYTLVLVWALVGIYVQQNDAALVAYTAAGLALVLALAAVYAIGQQFSAKPDQTPIGDS